MTDLPTPSGQRSASGSTARRGFDLVQSEPAQARRMLDGVRADPSASPDDRTIACWGLGRLAMDGNDITAALTIYPEAVAAGADTSDDALVAQIRLSWAAALQAAGQLDLALEQFDLAEPFVEGAGLGRLLMQRGLLRSIAGDRHRAIEDYDAALALLDGAGDEIAVMRLTSNRGVVLVQLGRLTEARDDFAVAIEMAERLSQDVVAAGAAHNAAYTDARQGNLPDALRGFADARARYALVGSPGRYLADLDIDEAAVLIEAGLGAEAVQTARRVVEACERDGNEQQHAEALLTLARAHLLAGDHRAAAAAAGDAETHFERHGRDAWTALARQYLLQAEHPTGRGVDPNRLAALAGDLERFGWAVEAVEVRVMAARAALHDLGSDAAPDPDVVIGQVGAARRSPITRVRADAWLVTALGQVARGDLRGARRSLATGLRTVERYRATLGAAELRSAAGRLGAELAELGVELAVRQGDSRDVLTWAERWRAGALGVPLAPDRPAVPVGVLGELRQARLALDAVSGEPAPAGAAERVRRLEQEVSRLTRGRRSAAPSRRRQRLSDLIGSLGDCALVEFVHTSGRLVAVTGRDRRVSHVDIGPLAEATAAAEHLAFATRRLSMVRDPDTVGRASKAFDVARVDLDRLLFGHLGSTLRHRPLVVIPSADLHHVLWNALPTANRPGGLTTAPSAVWWATPPRPSPGSGTLLVSGPSLAHADAEIEAISALIPDAAVLRGADASVQAVIEAMSGAGVVHLAAHGRFRADNPWFSTLGLADGALHVHELDALRTAPDVVVVAACSSGRSGVLAGDELLGTAAALLAVGVRTVIAPQLPIDDQAAVGVAVTIHQALLDGTHPAAALAALVERSLVSGDAPTAAAAASFTYMSAR